MKIILASLLLLCATAELILAQSNESAGEGALTEIKAPSSPASVIIGNQPSVISRPKSWNELEASMFSNFFNNSQLAIPNDFALEFSPFWSGNKGYIPIEEFMHPNVGQSLLQNLALSLSTTQQFIVNDSIKSNALGFGIRTMIWQGTRKDIEHANQLIAAQRRGQQVGTWSQLYSMHIISNLSDTLNDLEFKAQYIDALIDTLNKRFKEENFDAAFINEFFTNLRTDLEAINFPALRKDYGDSIVTVINNHDHVAEKTASLQQLRKDRNGFKLEFAFAASLNFPDNQVDYSVVPKWGFWVTPSFQPGTDSRLEFLGVLRYFHFYKNFYEKYLPNEPAFNYTIDFGARVVYKWNKFSVEFESIGRRSKLIVSQTTDSLTNLITTISKAESDFHWVLNFNYKINEKVIISYNFGKQFDPALSVNGNLISLLTLNYGIGAPKKSDLR